RRQDAKERQLKALLLLIPLRLGGSIPTLLPFIQSDRRRRRRVQRLDARLNRDAPPRPLPQVLRQAGAFKAGDEAEAVGERGGGQVVAVGREGDQRGVAR